MPTTPGMPAGPATPSRRTSVRQAGLAPPSRQPDHRPKWRGEACKGALPSHDCTRFFRGIFMSKPLTLARLLLISTALVAPTAMAQTDPATAAGEAGTTSTPTTADEAAAQSGDVDVSIPGADIIVAGRRTTNISQAAPQVVNILSAADIKRTGEGDIAGSLQRVTGLSVVSGGYVYFRALGRRYSLATLNVLPQTRNTSCWERVCKYVES